MTNIKTYSELVALATFDERYEYLRLESSIGAETFGFDRYLNQVLYRSLEWRKVRNKVIQRDAGFDLGVDGYGIRGRIIVHHMNPISVDMVVNRDPVIFDPEFLISTSHDTHNAIHFGDNAKLPRAPIVRSKNDTCLWR